MTDIIDVKKKIREILLADSAVSTVVGSRVYVGWLERSYSLPCITVVDSSESGEVAALGGAQDEYNGFVQVDVWCREDAKSGTLNRDELAKAVKVALGKKANFAAMQTAGFVLGSPNVVSLDELGEEMKPPLYRKSLRFPVTYYSESYV